MSSSSLLAATSTSTDLPLPSETDSPIPTAATQGNPVVAFLIGLSIILISSILNAGGLNLTKLDHVGAFAFFCNLRRRLNSFVQLQTNALPKSARRKEFLRPLWVIGMGTVVVVFGVIGIVAFGSINSGLHEEIDLDRLKTIWSRPGWLSYFLLMSLAIGVVYIGTSQLDYILMARADLSALPTHRSSPSTSQRNSDWLTTLRVRHASAMNWIREKLDNWTAAKDDKYVAWMLGIGWSCTGGGLAGACLIFAKATVKLVSLTVSGRASGSQFAHPATIFTVLLLALTAVTQIICLNRGLAVYDSTLVVPMFYGIYTAAGFINSLVFNDEVDAYQTWTLFCLGCSILVLIIGVVLLTHKKPEPKCPPPNNTNERDDANSLRTIDLDGSPPKTRKIGTVREDPANWEIGDDSDEEADTHRARAEGSESPNTPVKRKTSDAMSISPVASLRGISLSPIARRGGSLAGGPVQKHAGEEGRGLMGGGEEDEFDSPLEVSPKGKPIHAAGLPGTSPGQHDDQHSPPTRSPSSPSDDFGSWEDGGKR
ncbi:hypothetical protein FRB99_006834 [Tulasnella sp. 403]|nr:hypothetical protein FRB99_006834 [Tulasnella sp. 403]